ncbi:hypothetical protein ACVND7_12315 [Avibacterium paragallinarum]
MYKKLLVALLLSFPLVSNAGFFNSTSQDSIKIFKDYPFDMYRQDFLTKFPQFGRCQFNSSTQICAPQGYEKLYGIPFNIVILLDKNRTNAIQLKPEEYSIGRADFWGLFRGLIKSGFFLYQVKDENGSGNAFNDIAEGMITGQKINTISPKLDILESHQSTKQTLYYVEESKLNSILLGKNNKFSSPEDIMNRLPKDTRFIEMEVDSLEGESYYITLIISLPKLQVSKVDDRPTEKF